MKRTRTLAACLLSLAVAAAAFAQAPQAPKPGAEHGRLGLWVGKWTSEGEMKPSPFGPGGKMTGSDRCEWFEGKFAVVCHNEGKGPMGPMKGLGILSYSTEEKVYTYYGTDSSGMTMATVAKGTVQGDTWTYTDESRMGGKLIKGRYSMKVLSPTSYTFKWEMQGEGGQWTTVMEGKSTKVQ
jgi:hypothetical protein